MNAVTNGEAAKLSSFHGRIVASRKMEPTKKIAIRTITELRLRHRSGSADSAAAIVAISAPTIEKMTVTMPTVIAPKPSGMNPPWAHRLEKSIDLFGHKPNEQRSQRDEHTNRGHLDAGEPELELAEGRHGEQVGRHQDHQDHGEHSGMSIQYWMIFAPAIASKPTTITQKYQYNQPTEKPAQLPSALRE